MRGTVHWFYIGGPWSSSGIWFTLPFLIFSIPVAAMVNIKASKIGPKWFTRNSNGVIEPIHNTIKSSVMATEIEHIRNASRELYSWIWDGSVGSLLSRWTFPLSSNFFYYNHVNFVKKICQNIRIKISIFQWIHKCQWMYCMIYIYIFLFILYIFPSLKMK